MRIHLLLLGQCDRDLLRLAHPPAAAAAASVRSLVDLPAAVNRYLDEHNRKPKPFVWTADPNPIIEKLSRGYRVLASDL